MKETPSRHNPFLINFQFSNFNFSIFNKLLAVSLLCHVFGHVDLNGALMSELQSVPQKLLNDNSQHVIIPSHHAVRYFRNMNHQVRVSKHYLHLLLNLYQHVSNLKLLRLRLVSFRSYFRVFFKNLHQIGKFINSVLNLLEVFLALIWEFLRVSEL